MVELVFVRHGETDSNKRGEYLGWKDDELNSAGLAQAEMAKCRLSGIRFDAIYTSPLKRALKTAEIINKDLNVPLYCEDCLKEYNFGIWDGLTFNEIRDRYKDDFDNWSYDRNYCIEDGESANQVFERVNAFVDEILKGGFEGRFLIVTHLGCIRNALVHLLGMKPDDIWRFKIENGGITKVVINEGYAYLTLLNG